jgi:Flp pilus assembly pilin Flp
MHRRFIKSLIACLRDERGGEIMEYVLVGGLVIVGGIAVVLAFGGKVVARWNSVNNAGL